MTNRSRDWMRQAEADLKHAELSAREGDFEWSCFAAQQAAGKAVKALYPDLLRYCPAYPTDIFPLTEAELRERLEQDDPFLKRALSEGILLYSKDR